MQLLARPHLVSSCIIAQFSSLSVILTHIVFENRLTAVAAGVISWVINVGANFAHVSPSFKYKGVKQTDRYCDILDLFTELAISYIIQTIKQRYIVSAISTSTFGQIAHNESYIVLTLLSSRSFQLQGHFFNVFVGRS